MSRETTALFISPGDFQRGTGGSFYNRKLAESLRERGVRLDVVMIPDLPYFTGLIAGLAISPLLLLRLATGKYDLVIADGWAHPATILFNVICRMTGSVRLVIIAHHVRWRTMKWPVAFIARKIEGLGFRAAELIVTVSRFVSSEVEPLVGCCERIVIAHPGSGPLLATTRYSGTANGKRVRLLFVGNCTRLKGLDHLIEALGLLKDIPITLDVVGDLSFEPRFYKKLVRQAEALGVSQNVTFHGALAHQDLGSFYSRADIFTFPSLYEGFGIVLAEAMHAGLPIIATRLGPTNEILRENENALIVPAADPVAFAGAIRRLAADGFLRESFSCRSRELAASLPTWRQTCEDVCDRIEIMIQNSPDKTRTTMKTPKP
jgi:glycosyltransferase involved in cell wall biosynthesis